MSDLSPRRGPDLRASDAEREQTVETLRHAASEGRLNVEELEDRLHSAYTVATRRELESLVADVTESSLANGRALAPAGTAPPVVREGPGGSRWIVSVMSGEDRRGRWRIGPRCTVINVMGGSDLDLNDVELSDPVTHLSVISVMGGGQIRVPHGIEVQVSKFAFMGGNDVRLGNELPPPGGPVIRIRLLSIMGGTNVRRGRRRSREERELERQKRRELDDSEPGERELDDSERHELDP